MTPEPSPPKPESASAPPTQPPPTAPSASGVPMGYQEVAETVGMVPNLKVRDNLVQGITIAVFTLVAIIVGYVLGGPTGAAAGLIGGLLVSVLLSGVVLMVIGWIRVVRRRH